MDKDAIGAIVIAITMLLWWIAMRDFRRRIKGRWEIQKLTNMFDERRALHMAIRRHEHVVANELLAFYAEYIIPTSTESSPRELDDLMAHHARWKAWSERCIAKYQELLYTLEEKIKKEFGEGF